MLRFLSSARCGSQTAVDLTQAARAALLKARGRLRRPAKRSEAEMPPAQSPPVGRPECGAVDDRRVMDAEGADYER